jgi:6-phosphogluconolactonase (cycloisomerase 2 family)
MRRRWPRCDGRSQHARHLARAWVLLATAAATGCAPSPSATVETLATATYVYAFEPEQVTAYEIRSDGGIDVLRGLRNREVQGWGGVVVDPFGRALFGVTGERARGAIWAHAVEAASGTLTLSPDGPLLPPAHFWFRTAAVSPSGRFLFAGADPDSLGWGRVHTYAIDPSTPSLHEAQGSPVLTRIGTFRLWPDPLGRFLYVSNDQKRPDGPDCISGYQVDPASGGLTEIESSPFKTVAFVNQMVFSPTGGVAYATAGHYLLAYRIENDGALTPLPVPDEPTFEAAGTYVFSLLVSRDGHTLYAFQQSGWILTYHIGDDGLLRFVGELRGPSSYEGWLFHPTANVAFVLGQGPTAIQAHSVDTTTGLLTILGAPVPIDGSPTGIRGEKIFLDATGEILGVVAQRQIGSAFEAELHTFRIALPGGQLTPIATARVGSTPGPNVAVVRRAPTWLP